MGELNWNLLGLGQNSFGDAFAQSFERGQKMAEGIHTRRALADYQADPNNKEAFGYLMSVNAPLALRLEERAQGMQTRDALADYLLDAGGGVPARSGAVNALMAPGGPMGATPPAPQSSNALAALTGAPASGMQPPPNPGFGAPPQAPPSRRRSPAYERAVRADPEKFLTIEGKRVEVTHDQLKMARDLNDTAMQLLGGVHDQTSMDQARERARSLYADHGVDFDTLGVPDTYSPDVVRQLQMQGMDTSKQLQAIARENRLNWDIEDDQLDNDRADLNTDSMIDTRRGQLSNTRRGQDLADARGKRGQDLTDKRHRRGQDLADQRARDGVSGRGGGRGAAGRGGGHPEGTIIENKATGQKMVRRDGKWVPTK